MLHASYKLLLVYLFFCLCAFSYRWRFLAYLILCYKNLERNVAKFECFQQIFLLPYHQMFLM